MGFEKTNLELAGKYLIKNKLTLAVAESVTSGFLQAAFSTVTDARKFFQGGITAYNLGQKVRHLNIEPVEAEATNCVSEKVATEMALNISTSFLSNIGVGITGYAAPVPELKIKEIFAFYSFTIDGEEIKSGKISSKKADPVEVQIDYVNQLVTLLLKEIELRVKN